VPGVIFVAANGGCLYATFSGTLSMVFGSLTATEVTIAFKGGQGVQIRILTARTHKAGVWRPRAVTGSPDSLEPTAEADIGEEAGRLVVEPPADPDADL
jgi:hypothetical protein